jgi:hypothetical protein
LASVGANVTRLAITNGDGHYFRVGAYNAAGETFSDWIFADYWLWVAF